MSVHLTTPKARVTTVGAELAFPRENANLARLLFATIPANCS